MTHPSLLMYLFANYFIGSAEFFQRLFEGQEQVPCTSEVRVPKKQLASEMLVSALWALRETGLIQLEVGTRRNAVGLRGNVIFASVISLPESKPDLRHGLERTVLTSLRQRPPNGDQHDVKSMIREWFPKKVLSPYDDVLAIEVAEARRVGLFEEVISTKRRGRMKTMLFGNGESWTPRCDLIRRLEPEARALQESWFRFRANDRTLYVTMLDQCGSALNSREQDTGG